MKAKRVKCALCKGQRTAARNPSLPADLRAALFTCCHLWLPDVNDPICIQCQNFYRSHLKEHDGKSTTFVGATGRVARG
jgi:hypothetical protein